MVHKICPTCKQDLPIENFYVSATTPDGHCYSCKNCASQAHKIWRKKNSAHLRVYAKAYGATVVGIYRRRFATIKQRCNDFEHSNYKNYGGRGIKCKFKNSDEFLEYVTNTFKQHPKGLEIDRINNDGHYEPGNLRLVTKGINLKNRRITCKQINMDFPNT